MIPRKAFSSVISVVIILAVTIVIAVSSSMLYRDTAFSDVKVEIIEYVHIYATRTTDVENSKWKIDFLVANRGTQSLRITNVYINEQEVDVYDMEYGGTLEDGSTIGTGLSTEGYQLESGAGINITIWIGENLFSEGTSLKVSLNPINNAEQLIIVKLN